MMAILEATNKGAVYIDGIRITKRFTKWGVHHTVFMTECAKSEIKERLIDAGLHFHAENIDPKWLKENER